MNGALHQLQSASDRSFGLLALFHLLIEEVPEGAGQRAASEGGKPEIVGVKYSVQSRFVDLNRNNIESPKFEIEYRIDPELQQDLEALFDRTPGDRLKDMSSQSEVCRRIGEALFRDFFTAAETIEVSYRAYRNNHRQPRILFHLPRSLHALPWEVIIDPADPQGQFIALYGSVGRCDTITKEENASYGKLSALSILFLVASPHDDQLEIDHKEIESLDNVAFLGKRAVFCDFKTQLDQLRKLSPKHRGEKLWLWICIPWSW